MKITNIMHFTESQNFYAHRDFSLSSLDHKVLISLYQPMIGASAVSLFMLMCQLIPADQLGFSPLMQQRKLFLGLDIEPNESGRKKLIEQCSKLEAVGLLQTLRKWIPEQDEHIYEYRLIAPLSPQEFFNNQHLVMYLRDKIGKYMLVASKEQFFCEEPEWHNQNEVRSEDLSVPFYDLFQLQTHSVDHELEQALLEIAPSLEGVTRRADQGQVFQAKPQFKAEDILLRFPKNSFNRPYIEMLSQHLDQLATINYVAVKYSLSLQDLCRLLDEDDVFTSDGELAIDALQNKANLHFRQEKKRDEQRERILTDTPADSQAPQEQAVAQQYYVDVPQVFAGKCDIHQYNWLMRNEPYTQFIQRFYPGAVPDHVLNIIERLDLNYKIGGEIINVLIHHLMIIPTMPWANSSTNVWSKAYTDAIAADMLARQIIGYEQAIEYFRNKLQSWDRSKRPSTSGSIGDTGSKPTRRSGGKSVHKPHLPMVSGSRSSTPLTDQEVEEMKRMAQKLDGGGF